MSVPAAYLGLILIWSTTPLAIQWSAEGNFMFGVTSRMVLGAAVVFLVLRLRGIALVWERKAWSVYLVSGLSLYLSMTVLYWASQHIPSGWISVIFGLLPIMTAVMASQVLDENSLTPAKLIGMLMGLAGLALVFVSGQKLGSLAVWGVLGILFSTFVQAAGAVWLKYLDHSLSGLQVNVGGLLIAIPCFALTGILMGIDWMPELSDRAFGSILYLALVGTALGFTLYFYVLKNVSATRVSLIALVTPVCTLLIGSWLNNEPIIASVWVGAFLIGAGLICFELASGKNWLRKVRAKEGEFQSPESN